jgi:hypothetical protein
MTGQEAEALACTPKPLAPNGFNPTAVLPYGCTVEHLRKAMQEFLDFLGFINTQLRTKQIPRLECFLMPANFSSMVGEFIIAAIPKHCPSVAKNVFIMAILTCCPRGFLRRIRCFMRTKA